MSPLNVSSSTILLTRNMRRKHTVIGKPRGPEKRAARRWLRNFSKQLYPTKFSNLDNFRAREEGP
jgi:hypothetical protein